METTVPGGLTMMKKNLQAWVLTIVIVCSIALVAQLSPVAAKPQQSHPDFSGQATAVRATVLGITTVISDTGPLPASGGAQETSLLEATVPGTLSAEVLHASTVGQGDRSRSEASVANLSLTVGGNSIGADFLMARAMAICSPSGASTAGSSEIAALVVNGQAVVVDTQPNQTILLPNGTIVINEQNRSAAGKTSNITVNALHIIVNGVADIVIASAHADITCAGQPACEGQDFVTGGGWIPGTPSGAKGNFGVAGGIKNGSLWGHLTYIDHGPNGPKVKGTAVTSYVVLGPTARRIEGLAEINGQGGFTYRVDVTDNGEPGRSDTFALMLSNGYTGSGNLAGGNIQLHHPCH